MSTNEQEKPGEEKPEALDMRSTLLPQSPSEIDLQAKATEPPPLEGASASGVDLTQTLEAFASAAAEQEGATGAEQAETEQAEAPLSTHDDLDATTAFTPPTVEDGAEMPAPEGAAAEDAATEGAAAEGATAETLEGPPAEGLLAGAADAGEEPPPEEAEEEEEKPGLFARIAAHINAYDMLLVVAFIAMLLGTLCLAQELIAYKWDTKAKSGRQPVSAAWPSGDRLMQRVVG